MEETLDVSAKTDMDFLVALELFRVFFGPVTEVIGVVVEEERGELESRGEDAEGSEDAGEDLVISDFNALARASSSIIEDGSDPDGPNCS